MNYAVYSPWRDEIFIITELGLMWGDNKYMPFIMLYAMPDLIELGQV